MVMRLRVTEVKEGMPAANAGIKVGDILEKYNETELTCEDALSHAARIAQGNEISIALIRQGDPEIINLPAGRLGIEVKQVEFDPETYFKEEELSKRARAMAVTTTHAIDGYGVSKFIDVISAEAVCGVGLITEFLASFSDTFGGRNKAMQNQLRYARADCMSELKLEAARLGANAVIGINLNYNEISGQGKSMLFVVASGTAVVIDPIRT